MHYAEENLSLVIIQVRTGYCCCQVLERTVTQQHTKVDTKCPVNPFGAEKS